MIGVLTGFQPHPSTTLMISRVLTLFMETPANQFSGTHPEYVMNYFTTMVTGWAPIKVILSFALTDSVRK